MNAPTLAIELWRNEIRVARDHPAPHAVEAQVDAITRAVQAELALAVEPYLERHRGEVFLIRSLEIELDLDLACDTTLAARALARRVTRRLVESIESTEPQVLRFASQAAYAARFVVDLAAGRAWGCWYYAAFDGLRMLPTAAAIRTVLTFDDGVATLAAIAPEQWPALLDALDDTELRRVLDELPVGAPCDGTAAPGEALLDAVRDERFRGIDRTPALALALAASCARAGAALDAYALAAAEVVALAVQAHRRGEHALFDALTGRPGAAEPPLSRDAAGARVFVHLSGVDGRSLRALAQAARAALDGGASAAAEAACAESTPVAHVSCAPGLVILLDELAALFTGAAGLDSACLLAVLACAAGPEHAAPVWHDAAWRAVLGVDARFTWEAFTARLRDDPHAAQARVAHETHAARHLRDTTLHLRFREPPTSCGAPETAAMRPRIVVESERSTGMWCALTRVEPPIRDAATGLHLMAADEGPAEPASNGAPRDGLAVTLPAARQALRDWRALDHALLHDGCPPAWRAVFIACAQFAWRRIAQRVPGMRGASLPYLRANLLGRRGSMSSPAAGRWHWQVVRPPLHVLIAMTGIARDIRLRGQSERNDARSDEIRIDLEWI